MTRKNDNLRTVTEKLDALFAEMKPDDMLILAMGAIAGSQGYTPLTFLFGDVANGNIERLRQQARQGDAVAGGVVAASNLGPLASIPTFGVWGFIGGLIFPATVSGPDISGELEWSAGAYAKLAMACIGAIEAYAITRPGTIQGIGEIVKGIGEIVPG